MKCKLNQLCFIIKAIRNSNLGKVVETVEYLGYFIEGEPLTWNGRTWLAHTTDHMWVIRGNLETYYGKAKLAVTSDTWLHPIDAKLEDECLTETKELEIVK